MFKCSVITANQFKKYPDVRKWVHFQDANMATQLSSQLDCQCSFMCQTSAELCKQKFDAVCSKNKGIKRYLSLKMLFLCRLCAKCIDATEQTTKVSELQLKLSTCCGWNPAENEDQMPQKACSCCVAQLQTSWSFAESVWAAEKQLYKLASESIQPNEILELHEDIKIEETEAKPDISSNLILDDPDESFDDDGVFGEPIGYSDAESMHSSKSQTQATIKKRVRKKRTKKDPFIAALDPEDCLAGGLISSNGLQKLEKLFPLMKTVSWNECKYKCDKCDRNFLGPNNFYAHIRSIHLDEVKTIDVLCIYCNSTHRREYALNRHIASEHFLHLKYR